MAAGKDYLALYQGEVIHICGSTVGNPDFSSPQFIEPPNNSNPKSRSLSSVEWHCNFNPDRFLELSNFVSLGGLKYRDSTVIRRSVN